MAVLSLHGPCSIGLECKHAGVFVACSHILIFLVPIKGVLVQTVLITCTEVIAVVASNDVDTLDQPFPSRVLLGIQDDFGAVRQDEGGVVPEVPVVASTILIDVWVAPYACDLLIGRVVDSNVVLGHLNGEHSGRSDRLRPGDLACEGACFRNKQSIVRGFKVDQ